MYRTYKTEVFPEKETKFEERLIPREVHTSHAPPSPPSQPFSGFLSGIFNSVHSDDLLIIGILLLLLNENCEDTLILVILGVLLFIK